MSVYFRTLRVNDRFLLFFFNSRDLRYSTFFETPEVGIIDIFCVTSNENKLEIVANNMNLNTSLDLSRAY